MGLLSLGKLQQEMCLPTKVFHVPPPKGRAANLMVEQNAISHDLTRHITQQKTKSVLPLLLSCVRVIRKEMETPWNSDSQSKFVLVKF